MRAIGIITLLIAAFIALWLYMKSTRETLAKQHVVGQDSTAYIKQAEKARDLLNKSMENTRRMTEESPDK